HNELFDGINEYASIYHDGCIIHSEKSGRRYLVLFNPELIKKVLQTNNRKYVKGLGIDKVKMLLGNGIMVSEGDYWRKQRRMIQPGFGKEEFGKLAKTVLSRNKKMETLWHAKAMSGEPLNISEDMSGLALNIILEVIFSDSIYIDGNASPFHMLS
ncbi:MAG: cytochrome P450, partial [Flammeovirgaceae bacterium]